MAKSNNSITAEKTWKEIFSTVPFLSKEEVRQMKEAIKVFRKDYDFE